MKRWIARRFLAWAKKQDLATELIRRSLYGELVGLQMNVFAGGARYTVTLERVDDEDIELDEL